jgi:hypothetical protein
MEEVEGVGLFPGLFLAPSPCLSPASFAMNGQRRGNERFPSLGIHKEPRQAPPSGGAYLFPDTAAFTSTSVCLIARLTRAEVSSRCLRITLRAAAGLCCEIAR